MTAKLDDAEKLAKQHGHKFGNCWPSRAWIRDVQDQALEVAAGVVEEEFRSVGFHGDNVSRKIRKLKNKQEPVVDERETARAQVRTMLSNSADAAINRGEHPYAAELRNALDTYKAWTPIPFSNHGGFRGLPDEEKQRAQSLKSGISNCIKCGRLVHGVGRCVECYDAEPAVDGDRKAAIEHVRFILGEIIAAKPVLFASEARDALDAYNAQLRPVRARRAVEDA